MVSYIVVLTGIVHRINDYSIPFSLDDCEFKKNLNASKPSEHPPQVEQCLKV